MSLDVKNKTGFTIIEILVVITIIALLASIATFSYVRSVQRANDAKRMQDVQSIAGAIDLFRAKYGRFPDCAQGIVIEPGTRSFYTPNDPAEPAYEVDSSSGSPIGCADRRELLTFLETYFVEIPADPLGPGNDNYYYYYDSNRVCPEPGNPAVVFAANMEIRDNSNRDVVCNTASGNDGYFLTNPVGDPNYPYVNLVGTGQYD